METLNFCRLCGGHNIFDIGKANGFTLSKCKGCSLVFVRETVDDEYLARYYSLSAEQKTEQKTRSVYLDAGNESNLKYAYKKVADKIKTHFKNTINPAPTRMRILDLGCSNGSFLDLFPDWDVYGVELEETAGKIAKQKHPNVFIGDMKQTNFEKNYFDCITIQDALDHSNDPYAVVKYCHLLLKPNGLIVIKVHNIDCLLAKISGNKFYAIIPPAHLTYFNLKTLKMLLEKNKFDYTGHFYNTQKLRLDTAIMRASTTLPFLKPVSRKLGKTFLGNIPLYKNFHDIITVMGVKSYDNCHNPDNSPTAA
jgi:2-polyprenyl-3-methyl-5-hydroxy-6-metoxy-1,4-benzoquinol methylase